MLEHGGRVRAAAQRYGISEGDWLDLSTGINPQAWPAPVIPHEIWQQLPQDDDDLNAAARHYYGTTDLLAVAGSQAAIQALPKLRASTQVALVTPSYAEHAHAWRQHGHQVMQVPETEILHIADSVQVVVIVHPNNPTGKLFERNDLLVLHQRLAERSGWLIVDEAFMDASPEHSLANDCPLEGLIVLRSVGKFFGLAGARVGFVLADKKVLYALRELLGPWPIATPSRYVATRALQDLDWQTIARNDLYLATTRLAALLEQQGSSPNGGTALFQWVCHNDAANVHLQLAQQGVLTRLFEVPSSLRFGLPRDEAQWQHLMEALNRVKR